MAHLGEIHGNPAAANSVDTECEWSGKQMLLFLWKCNDFTCSLHIMDYTENQQFPLEEGGKKRHSSFHYSPGALTGCLRVWVGGWNSVCVC